METLLQDRPQASTCASTSAPVYAHTAAAHATLSQALAPDNLQKAWERVQANDGMAGVDGEELSHFGAHLGRQLDDLCDDVLQHHYQPRPLRWLAIKKPDGGTRELAVPSVRDRVLQTAVVRALQPSIDPYFCDASYAYRPARSVPLALAEVEYWRDMGLRWVFESDIQSFFDRIPHTPLLQVVSRWVADVDLCCLIESWVKAIICRPTPELLARGVPQGSPLSPLLANLYLHQFDTDLQGAGHHHVRYADDFLVLASSHAQAMQAWADAQAFLKRLSLNLKESKTHVTSFDDGFEFLGARLQGNRIVEINPDAHGHVIPKAKHRATVRSWKAALAAPDCTQPHDGDANTDEPQDAACTAQDTSEPALDPGSDGSADIDVNGLDEQSPIARTLYVTTAGARVLLRTDRIVVQGSQSTPLASVPAAKVDQIVVYGNSLVSTALLRDCATQGVAVHLLDHRGNRAASVEPDPCRNTGLWLAQVQALGDEEATLALAGAFVQGKLRNQRTVLQRWVRKHPHPQVAQAINQLNQTLDASNRRLPLENLRGHEGSAARVYFAAMAAVLGDAWPFAKRTRQPARDAINSMLNFGYTLLHRLVLLHLVRRQLNPHLGHLHQLKAGHAALASDLMEELRAPLVDALVVDMALHAQWKASDFLNGEDGAVWLPLEMRRDFITRWETALARPILHPQTKRAMDWQRIIEFQVQHYARVLQGQETVYRPMLVR